jgi:hypothetical protein
LRSTENDFMLRVLVHHPDL